MKLVELFLPCQKSNGKEVDACEFEQIERTLTEMFGGVTAYHRAPAIGRWRDSKSNVEVDEITVVEVMIEHLDRAWWHQYRSDLLRRFEQEELLIRVTEVELL
jgi:hypothetical protein